MTTLSAIGPSVMIVALCCWVVYTEKLPALLRNTLLMVAGADVILSVLYAASGTSALWSASLYLELFAIFVSLYAMLRKLIISGRDDED